MADNKDYTMMENCINAAEKQFSATGFEHPLDSSILQILRALRDSVRKDTDDFEIFKYRETQIDPLWKILIEKSIKCLRFHDVREPFSTNANKTPRAYGVDKLAEYYQKYTEFERILYGSSKYYRDHVIHVIRTWLSGIESLTNNDGAYLACIAVQGAVTINDYEKLSMWTIIALTHDLGYPLEQATKIIDTTRAMVSTFVTEPRISMDLAFHGVQNYMNDFVVRLMSSKMIEAPTKEGTTESEYFARLQPKYYFKFQKSLEGTKHGIISTLIIYKLLTYFLESDYNINEDYRFNAEDCRQFYIRREILRAIASHTCKDVYHLYMGSFAFLLIISDDTQEWGRKYLSELYVGSNREYQLNEMGITISSDTDTNPHNCTIDEEVTMPIDASNVKDLIVRLREQSLDYITIFRDGQDTTSRDFSFERKFLIKCSSAPNVNLLIRLLIMKDSPSELTGVLQYSSNGTTNKCNFGQDFIQMLADAKLIADANSWLVYDRNGKVASKNKPETWYTGNFRISLGASYE